MRERCLVLQVIKNAVPQINVIAPNLYDSICSLSFGFRVYRTFSWISEPGDLECSLQKCFTASMSSEHFSNTLQGELNYISKIAHKYSTDNRTISITCPFRFEEIQCLAKLDSNIWSSWPWAQYKIYITVCYASDPACESCEREHLQYIVLSHLFVHIEPNFVARPNWLCKSYIIL